MVLQCLRRVGEALLQKKPGVVASGVVVPLVLGGITRVIDKAFLILVPKVDEPSKLTKR